MNRDVYISGILQNPQLGQKHGPGAISWAMNEGVCALIEGATGRREDSRAWVSRETSFVR